MTAHLICVMGLFVLGGDPMYAGNPPVAAEVAAPAPYFAGPPQAMFAPTPPPPTLPPPAPPPVAPGAISAPEAPPAQAAANGAAPASNEYGPGSAAAAAPPAGVQYFSLDELEAEMKKLAWTKGDFTITPYGILWANLVEETGRTTPGNYPLYVARPREDANGDCYVDARSTRLGFDILGPQIPLFGGAQTGGKIEFDFQRQIDVENKSTVLLRHAYIEVKDDDARLLAGQTWDVISPLCPGVLFYSVGWDGGNIGYRRPQFRAERRFECSDTFALIAQGSLNTCAPTDVSGTPETYTALASDWPILEGRLATQWGPRGPGCLPWEFGVSSHVGELIYDFHANTPTNPSPFAFTEIGAHRRTWSLNVDMHVPITHCFGVQGELFMGENLGPFFGGVGQSVDIVSYTDPEGVFHPASGDDIRSRGGWVDVWYDWTPRLHSHVGYSIDNPFYQDVTSGRVYNAFVFANVSYDVTAKFLVGFEYTSWRTLWVGPSADATSQNFNFVAKYAF